jgi:ATP-dependent helicase HrpA
MFLDHALVRGEYTTRGDFQRKNQELLAEVARLRDKARRSDMLADDDALLTFFDRRVPDDVVNGKTFEAWREAAEKADPRVLHLSLEDVLAADPDLSPAAYPDEITLHGAKIPVAYRFDPSADDDGITLTVPLVLLPQLDPGELDWTIPGWHREKIIALLYELPRAVRKELGEVADVARALAQQLRPFDGPMIPALARAIAEVTGARVPADAFRPEAVAAYLRLTLRVVDEKGKVIAQGRDIDDLLQRFGARARAVWKESAPSPKWERKGTTTWDFGDLPEMVTRRVANVEVRSYPAIVDRGTSVDLVLLESAAAAEDASRAGVRRLVMLAKRSMLSQFTPRLPAAFPHANGAPTSRAENEAFRSMLLAKIVDAAFQLDVAGVTLPRTKAAFEQLLASGTPRVGASFQVHVDALKPISTELEKVLQALRSASRHPSGRNAVVDIYAQLEHLFPPDLLDSVPFGQLDHFPRYLRAAQARLQRAISDPRKDADKLAPFTPLWASLLTKRKAARDQALARDLRWMLEELRVAIFAPELKTPYPVSAAKVAAALSTLR